MPLDSLILRDADLAVVHDGITQLGERNRNILVFYGDPNHTWRFGKRLYREFAEQDYLCALIDGEGLTDNTASPLEKGLLLLRSHLGAGSIDFSCYDIAYWCYWSALNPHSAVDTIEFTQKMSQADKLSTFADLVGAASNCKFKNSRG